MIYRDALAQGATSNACGHSCGFISIANMDSTRYQKRKNRKRIRSRTSYKAIMEDTWCDCDCPGHWGTKTTTYTLDPCLKLLACGLLSVSRQISQESMSVFYGENTFQFDDMAAVAPFFQDRSVVARRYIRSVQIVVTLLDDDHHFDRQAECIKAFRYMSRHLDLSELHVSVWDCTFRWWAPVETSGSKTRWLRVLTEINNLEKLEFSLDFVGMDSFYEELIDEFDDDEDEINDQWESFQNWMVDNEIEYVNYLRKRMIKKKQTRLDKWLWKHDCNAECKEFHKGRLAQRSGLPKSDTRGLWILPEVDLDALYDEDHPDELDDNCYSYYDEEDESDESDLEEHEDTAVTEVSSGACHAPNSAERDA